MIHAFTDNTVYTDDGFTDGYGLFWKKSELYFDPLQRPLGGRRAVSSSKKRAMSSRSI